MRRTLLTVFALAVLAPAAVSQDYVPDVNGYPREASFPEVLKECSIGKPKELFDVLRVIDGDTLWIERSGQREKLRLLSVDTEEKFMERDISASKPSTRYGDLVTGWTQGFFTPRTADEGPVRIGLRFPGGVEQRDVYGRLLCHVVTENGVDFNLLLVRMGLSPYFNKYGNSRIDHDGFVQAQERAVKEARGVWNPGTNKSGKKRPYARLLPWWKARGDAVQAFREKAAEDPTRWAAADEPEALEHLMKASAGKEVTLLCLVDRFFDEDDGSRTVLLRGGDKRRSVRVRIAPDQRKAMKEADLEGSKEDFRQNYLLVTGVLARGKRGFDLTGVEPGDWRRAGLEPSFK